MNIDYAVRHADCCDDHEAAVDALKQVLRHIDAYEDNHSYCDTQAGEGWDCSCGWDEQREQWQAVLSRLRGAA